MFGTFNWKSEILCDVPLEIVQLVASHWAEKIHRQRGPPLKTERWELIDKFQFSNPKIHHIGHRVISQSFSKKISKKPLTRRKWKSWVDWQLIARGDHDQRRENSVKGGDRSRVAAKSTTPSASHIFQSRDASVKEKVSLAARSRNWQMTRIQSQEKYPVELRITVLLHAHCANENRHPEGGAERGKRKQRQWLRTCRRRSQSKALLRVTRNSTTHPKVGHRSNILEIPC